MFVIFLFKIDTVVLDFFFQNRKHQGYGLSTTTSHCAYKFLKGLISTRSAGEKRKCVHPPRGVAGQLQQSIFLDINKSKGHHPCFSINVHVVKNVHIYKIQTIWLNRAES